MGIGTTLVKGIPLIGSTIAGISEAQQEKKNRKWQEEQNQKDYQFQREMYEWSRWDAKADWEREAAYNSPEEQMNRLRQAGLNPNLVYGKGADNTMSSVRSGQMTGGSKPAPQQKSTVFGDTLSKYYQLQNIQANTDNLAQSTALGQEEVLVKRAAVAKAMQETATSKFELQKAMELKDEVIRQAQLNNQKTEVDIQATKTSTQLAVNEDERRQISNAVNVEKTVQDIYESKLRQTSIELQNSKNPQEREKLAAEIKQLETITSNAKIEGSIKALDLKLREKGINPNDPMYARMLGNALQNNELMENVDKAFEEWFKAIEHELTR